MKKIEQKDFEFKKNMEGMEGVELKQRIEKAWNWKKARKATKAEDLFDDLDEDLDQQEA